VSLEITLFTQAHVISQKDGKNDKRLTIAESIA